MSLHGLMQMAGSKGEGEGVPSILDLQDVLGARLPRTLSALCLVMVVWVLHINATLACCNPLTDLKHS